jgi:glycosyltransferase involved in cell wall biosynthesis
MSTKPSLLYLSPVIPALTGNGLAMRAGTVLEVLAERYDVHLLVVSLYAPVTPQIPGPLERLCRRAAIVSPRPPRRGGFLRAGMWGAPRFDVVHVFRLATLPFSEPYLRGLFRRPRRHLDLDDIESLTRRRLATLYRQNGESAIAAHEEFEAARCERLEEEAFQRFDRVYVCSASDRSKLESRMRAEVRVLPNAVRMPGAVPARGADGIFTFFFVGTLGYYPNEDGVRYLCAEVVPRIRDLAGSGFVVNIAGTGASESLRQAASVPQVRFLGAVADLHPWYAQAHAVVAPVRAGGGTRIKILEAFSYQRPVVATSTAMEGIEARVEEHVVIGDTPAAFAQQCARLMADAELRDRLAQNALALVKHSYTIDSLRRALDEMEGNSGSGTA